MRWLPIDITPYGTFSIAWNGARMQEDVDRLYDTSTNAVLSGQDGYSQEFRYLLPDGRPVWVSEVVRIEPNGPDCWRLVGVCTDITERKALEETREKMLVEALERADRDPLTGLLNHRVFHARLEEEADRALRMGTSLAVAIIDMDNFKFFNDCYGHSVGDEVLLQVARALSACSRSYDSLARYGGDEFGLLMPGNGPDEAARLAGRLRAALAGIAYQPPGHDVAIPLHLSVGVAVFPDEAPTRREALEMADANLRRAKSGGDIAPGMLLDRLRPGKPGPTGGFSMLSAMVSSVDNKDRYTRTHSEQVLAYSQQIAQALGLDEQTKYYIQVAALLHDIGKIGVPDRVLRKPGKLTDEEYDAIKQHPMMGAVIVEAVPGFEKTVDAIRHHHERWDGNGYPYGLHREETPLMARVMAVADAYSAMTSNRPYRMGMSQEEALAKLTAGAGTQWDPDCVAAFVSAQRRERARR
jgi:diguanylate cyclase (GGDEF)-like protein/putative nucleotidyltransferase with HDIG domain